jgi:hypothetical protein
VDFKTATDVLTRRVTAEEIAEASGVSISTIARARLESSSPAYRTPPAGWERAVHQLAEQRCRELRELADALAASA